MASIKLLLSRWGSFDGLASVEGVSGILTKVLIWKILPRWQGVENEQISDQTIRALCGTRILVLRHAGCVLYTLKRVFWPIRSLLRNCELELNRASEIKFSFLRFFAAENYLNSLVYCYIESFGQTRYSARIH